MQARSPRISVPTALLITTILTILTTTAFGQGLQATYTNDGLQTLAYDGVTLLDLSPGHSEGERFIIHGYHKILPTGEVVLETAYIDITMDYTNRTPTWTTTSTSARSVATGLKDSR